MIKNINDFEKNIDYIFNNQSILYMAFTHSSYANENKLQSNERLEFLGDSILNMIISEYLYLNCSKLSEGELSKIRSNIVCEASLVKCAKKTEMGNFLLLGKGEEISGGRERPSILSDVFEAVIGAIYIDRGIEHAKKFIFSQMKNIIKDSVKGSLFTDYKTLLQEIVQRNNQNNIIYEIIKENGPDHDKIFIAQVKISGKVMGKGEGKTKKEAEQLSAKSALESKYLCKK